MNVPYPPFLGHKRDVDLIIAPDFSGEAFEVQLRVFESLETGQSSTSSEPSAHLFSSSVSHGDNSSSFPEVNWPKLRFISYQHSSQCMAGFSPPVGHIFSHLGHSLPLLQSLTLAKEYAEERKKPFPKIDGEILQERNWPKDCYVFEGKGKEPTIIYMPLFNRVNCRGLLD